MKSYTLKIFISISFFLLFFSCKLKKDIMYSIKLPRINPLLKEKSVGIIVNSYEKVYKNASLTDVSTLLKENEIVNIKNKIVLSIGNYNIKCYLISSLNGVKLGYILAQSLILSSNVRTANNYLKYIKDNLGNNLWLF